jgi:hypothetical protein
MANPGAVMLNVPQIRQDQHAIGSRITLNHLTLQNLEHLSNIDENMEAMIWPILFPYGKGSFKRIKNASYDIGLYARLRLFNWNSRWRQCIEYPFCLYDKIVRNACMYSAQINTINRVDENNANLNACDEIKIKES